MCDGSGARVAGRARTNVLQHQGVCYYCVFVILCVLVFYCVSLCVYIAATASAKPRYGAAPAPAPLCTCVSQQRLFGASLPQRLWLTPTAAAVLLFVCAGLTLITPGEAKEGGGCSSSNGAGDAGS